MKRKIALVVGLGVVLLAGVALAYEPAPCPDCKDTTTRAFYTCLNPKHAPVFTTQPAYYEPENGDFPPPMDWPCPICGTPCVADSADCTNTDPPCYWIWRK